MDKKSNFIISLITLSVTICLLIVTIFAWYSSNKNVSATGIMGSSKGDGYTLKLQRGYYDSNNSKWEWIDTEFLSFSNISPGNVFFFRIVMDSSDENSFTAVFKDIDSELQENKLVVENGFVCLKNSSKNIPLYEIKDSKVSIVSNEESKTLYLIDEYNNITLSDFLIHNTFYFYDFSITEPSNNIIPDGKSGTLLSSLDLTFSFDLNGNSSNCYYFALEFNDELSTETINGVECSNAYLYQKLIIGYISVTKQ